MFYAITGIGWGRGESIDEALENYYKAQRSNFRGITDAELDEAWGFVWQAPEGATGFYLDGIVHWKFEDRDPEEANPEQRVATIGTLTAAAMKSFEDMREGVKS